MVLNINQYQRQVLELYKDSVTSNDRINSIKSLEVLVEIEKAITIAKITNQFLDELYQLKADVELIRALNE